MCSEVASFNTTDANDGNAANVSSFNGIKANVNKQIPVWKGIEIILFLYYSDFFYFILYNLFTFILKNEVKWLQKDPKCSGTKMLSKQVIINCY